MTSDEIRFVCTAALESCKEGKTDALRQQGLLALIALMVSEIAAQCATLNENFSNTEQQFGPN